VVLLLLLQQRSQRQQRSQQQLELLPQRLGCVLVYHQVGLSSGGLTDLLFTAWDNA
jgi:hypothetical protein